jgi:hypothetical protein
MFRRSERAYAFLGSPSSPSYLRNGTFTSEIDLKKLYVPKVFQEITAQLADRVDTVTATFALANDLTSVRPVPPAGKYPLSRPPISVMNVVTDHHFCESLS